MIQVLAILLVALLAMTLLGHGLWVLAEWCWKQLFGSPAPAKRRATCPDCGGRLSPDGRCSWCDPDPENEAEQRRTELDTTLRQLRRLAADGAIDRASFDVFQTAVLAERRRLRGQPTEPAPVVAASAVREKPPIKDSPPEPVVTLALAEDVPPPAVVIPVEPLSNGNAPRPGDSVESTEPLLAVVAADEPSPPRRQPFRAMLTAFMEERNILWGELIGGLLIVGCSIALVVSLWPTLVNISYAPFVVFAGVTAALFGAGLYTLHHWKLESTSRGLLVIATLLVPLQFLLMARLHGPGAGSPIEVGLEIGFLGLFGYLVHQAARILTPIGVWWLPVAVLGCAIIQLLMSWVLPISHGLAWMLALGLAAVACSGISVTGVLRRWQPTQTGQLLLHLGMATFAVIVTLGLLTYWTDRLQVAAIAPILQRLAIATALAGMPLLVAGVRVHTELAQRSDVGGWRTAGTAVALAGMVVMLAALALAWPEPLAVLTVGVVDFAILTAVAVRSRLPVAHAVALPCLILSSLTLGLKWWPGVDANGLLTALGSVESGVILLVMFGLLGAAAELLVRLRRHVDARYYIVTAVVVSVLGLALISVPTRGIEHPVRALVLYAVCGLAGCVFNARWRWPIGVSLATTAFVGATLWGLFAFVPASQVSLWGTVLALESLGLAVGLRRVRDSYAMAPLARSAEALTVVAVLCAVWAGCWSGTWSLAHVLTGSSLCGALLILALSERRGDLARIAGLILGGTATALGGWLAMAVFQVSTVNLIAAVAWALAITSMALAAAAWWVTKEPSLAAEAAKAWRGTLSNAWRDIAVVTGVTSLVLAGLSWLTGTPTLVSASFIVLAIATFVLTHRDEQPAWTQIGSFLALAAILRLMPLRRISDQLYLTDVAMACLGHATLALAAAAGWRQVWQRVRAPLDEDLSTAVSGNLHRLFIGPLRRTALVSSSLGLIATLVAGWATSLTAAVCLVWLAALWLWLARAWRSAVIFSACQGACFIAAIYTAMAWLSAHPGYGASVLPIYGIALGLVTLGWAVVRRYIDRDPVLGALVNPPWQAVDRFVLGTLVWAQLGLAVLCLVPVLTSALSGLDRFIMAGYFGPPTWAIVSILAAALLVSLWDASAGAILPGFVLLAIIIPILAAGQAVPVQTAALILCGGLAGCFLICSALLLAHGPIGVAARRLGCRASVRAGELRLCGALLTVGTAVPLVGVTWTELVTRLGSALSEASPAWTDTGAWIALVEVSGLSLATTAFAWLRWGARLHAFRDPLLHVLMALPLLLALSLLAVPAGWLIALPGVECPAELLRVSGVGGWLTWLAASGVLAYAAGAASRRLIHVLAIGLIGIGVLAGLVAGYAPQQHWLSYHVLLGWLGVAAGVLLTTGWWLDSRSIDGSGRASRAWSMGLGVALVVLALRAAWDDPFQPYPSMLATTAAAAIFAVVALWRPGPTPVYVSGLLLNLAGVMAWIAWGNVRADVAVQIQVLCFSAGAMLWSVLEHVWPRIRDRRATWPAFAHVAAALALLGTAGMVFLAVTLSLSGSGSGLGIPLAWVALTMTAAAVACLLTDSTARFAGAGLYLMGILTLGLVLLTANPGPRPFGWWAGLGLAGIVLLAQILAMLRRRFDSSKSLADWFAPAQGMTGIVALGLSFWTALNFNDLPHRLAGPAIVVLLALAGVALVYLLTDLARSRWQITVLVLGVTAAIEFGWALIDPSAHTFNGLWLRRDIVLVVCLAPLTAIYGVAFHRWLPAADWAAAARRLGPVLGLAGTAALLLVLAQEAWLYHLDAEPLSAVAIATVLVALLILFVAGLTFALVPASDPFGLSSVGRQAYVYAAEVLLVLMGMHLRLTAPELFHLGWFAAYWPFIVLAVAFLAVGLGEFFQRRGLAVLAGPLERTGIGLPLLPVLACWLAPTGHYAAVWFLAGLVYGLVSIGRRSFRFGLLAALSANVGLWVLLHQHEVFLWRHAQLWLIPPALIILVAEHLNRDRLAPQQSLALRYLGIIAIYVSSTTDVFLVGLGAGWLLPLILLLLCVLGILMGMMLRVRAFLFVGSSFLVLTLGLIIWHAGVDSRQTWILWASGIGLGAIILAVFGVFEKRRDEVLRLVDDVRRWQ